MGKILLFQRVQDNRALNPIIQTSSHKKRALILVTADRLSLLRQPSANGYVYVAATELMSNANLDSIVHVDSATDRNYTVIYGICPLRALTDAEQNFVKNYKGYQIRPHYERFL